LDTPHIGKELPCSVLPETKCTRKTDSGGKGEVLSDSSYGLLVRRKRQPYYCTEGHVSPRF